MNQKKIYIAGKVTGTDRMDVLKKFDTVERKLISEGHKVINPLRIANMHDTWEIAMRKCIKSMMDCDEIHLLPCWETSKGAQIEKSLATYLKIPIKFL